MKRFVPPTLFLLLALAPVARAQHDVPVWYIEYEVTTKARHSAQEKIDQSIATTTWTLERVFAATAKLDMRNEGALISLTQSATMDPEKFKNMSQAEMMKYSQDMLSAMQYTANWMPGPLDVGEGDGAMLAHMQSQSVPVRIQYQAVTTGKDFVDEMNQKYDFENTKSATGSGSIYPGDQYKLEINTQAKKYWLLLPYGGQDMDAGTREIKLESVEKTRTAGSATWEEKRSPASDAEADWMPNGFKLDADSPVIEGAVDASGKIVGEKTFAAHFTDGPHTVPATVTYRYTVSQTPPAKKAPKK